MPLDTTIDSGETGHLAAHAALHAEHNRLETFDPASKANATHTHPHDHATLVAAGVVEAQASAPAADETALLVRVNRAGTITLDRVTVGAVDSAGVGFRVLRVAN